VIRHFSNKWSTSARVDFFLLERQTRACLYLQRAGRGPAACCSLRVRRSAPVARAAVQSRACHGRTRRAAPKSNNSSQSNSSQSSRRLAFTRYWFTLKLLFGSQSSFYLPRPPALPALLQYYCTSIAQETTPPCPPLCMLYTIQYG